MILSECPMKGGLRICGGSVPVVLDCGCHDCPRYVALFDDPHDVFLSNLIAHESRIPADGRRSA